MAFAAAALANPRAYDMNQMLGLPAAPATAAPEVPGAAPAYGQPSYMPAPAPVYGADAGPAPAAPAPVGNANPAYMPAPSPVYSADGMYGGIPALPAEPALSVAATPVPAPAAPAYSAYPDYLAPLATSAASASPEPPASRVPGAAPAATGPWGLPLLTPKAAPTHAVGEGGAQVSGAGETPLVTQLRFGVLAHNYGPIARREESGIDFSPELLFRPPAFLNYILAPSPTIGLEINSKGKTSFAYAGFTWGGDFWDIFTADFFFGGAVHNGHIHQAEGLQRRDFGCRALFREGINLGVRLNEESALTFFLDHYSHGGLCDNTNEGDDNFGLKLQHRF